MKRNQYRVMVDATYGYRRLDPIPSPAELSRFYESRYYHLLRKGVRAPELRRLMEGGAVADRERQWLRESLYTDIVGVLKQITPGRRLLEVGCGLGEFLSFANEAGFQAVGIEPAAQAVKRAVANHLTVHAATLDEFSRRFAARKNRRFDVIVMLNVLEHVPDAPATLEQCKRLLNPEGVVCIRVPNDFSEIQQAARAQIKKTDWWVAVPDHINYFGFESLARLLDGTGFKVAHAQGDFPMEMFLLMGDDYIGNPKVGGCCHERRRRFDLGLSPDLRRKIYGALAQAGVGRDCLVFGKRRRE